MKANQGQITRALDSLPADIRLYLLYGPDEASSLALAKRAERTLGADAERIDLSSSSLKEDPARLSDEAQSLSLFGDKRSIRIHPATEDSVPAITALLEAGRTENPVIAIAGALKPSSALLKIALAHPAVMACPSYVMEGRDAEAVAVNIAREFGLRLPADVARLIATAAGYDRAIMAQEIDKLALYLDAAPERPVEATAEALAEIGASVNDSALSRLVDAVMGGRSDTAAGALERLGEDGITGIPVLRAMMKRLALVAEIRSEVEAGTSPEAAVERRGKAVFFKEKPALVRDVSRWPADKISAAMALMVKAERGVKSAGSAGDIMADHDIIRTARGAARFR